VFEPYLTIFQSFPREALYPIFVIALGVGNLPQITNAALLAFFPMAVTTLHAVSDTRRDYIDLVRSWGATRLEEFAHVRLPYALPHLLGALRISIPFAIIGAVLAEMLGGSTNRGLGNLIVSAQAGQDATATYAAILILAAIGISVIASLQAIEYLALRRFLHE
jgi:NitT/TauT family transport system permease protein